MIDYLAILVFIIIGAVFGVVPLVLGYLLAPKKGYAAKRSRYECGFEPQSETTMPFYIRYYRIAILFILFDLEIAFLIPWVIVFRQVKLPAIIAMIIFILLLILGFIIEWRKDILEWD